MNRFMQVRNTALNAFIFFVLLILLLSAVESILMGDIVFGIALILGLIGVVVCVWHLSGDIRWFRKACVYPTTGIFVASWGYYTEGEPVCRLYLKDAPMESKTFSLCFNLLLPASGGPKAFEDIMNGLDRWMAAQPCSMRLLGRMSANCQFAEVEMCVRRKDAAPEILEALFDCFERTDKDCLEQYGRRYIRVEYKEQGHVFYAAFDGFDVGRAVILSGAERAFMDFGDSRDGLVVKSEAGRGVPADVTESIRRTFSLYADDCDLEKVRQTDLIPVEEFEAVWQSQFVSMPEKAISAPAEADV